MGKTKRETILFSCLGSTDPVRGERDGAMLHIARHYKPDRILWYMTKEMRLMAEKAVPGLGAGDSAALL